MRSGNNAEVAFKELDTANLQAFFDNLGSKLIDAVAVRITEDMVNHSPLVWRRAMLAEMLNAPIPKLSVRNEIYVVDDFFDGRALRYCQLRLADVCPRDAHTFSSSIQFSKMFCTTKLPVSPSATSCHIPRRASLTLSMIWGGSPLQRSSNSFCQTWQAYR